MRAVGICIVFVIGAASCTRSSTPPSTTTVESTPTPPADAANAASTDAAVAWKPVIDEVEGEGACKVDSDCELANWQPGCSCNGTCISYAISNRLLAAHVKQANCPKVRTKPCPPPVPCRQPTHFIKEAVCRAGTCFSVREERRPSRPDLGL